jgi:hypothetical protein
MTYTVSCDIDPELCSGDYELEIEGPDYEVGLMGYSAYLTGTFDKHDATCPIHKMTPTEIDKLSDKLSERAYDIVNSEHESHMEYMADMYRDELK